jgi:hypothetical protein
MQIWPRVQAVLNWSYGFKRLLLSIIALGELGIVAHISVELIAWNSEKVFDQFDADYVPIWERIQASLLSAVLLPIAGVIVWYYVGWIIRGFHHGIGDEGSGPTDNSGT